MLSFLLPFTPIPPSLPSSQSWLLPAPAEADEYYLDRTQSDASEGGRGKSPPGVGLPRMPSNHVHPSADMAGSPAGAVTASYGSPGNQQSGHDAIGGAGGGVPPGTEQGTPGGSAGRIARTRSGGMRKIVSVWTKRLVLTIYAVSHPGESASCYRAGPPLALCIQSGCCGSLLLCFMMLPCAS